MTYKNVKQINLIVLFVQYDQKKYNNSFETLHKVLSKNITINSKFIIIDNSITNNYIEQISDNILLINGDNTDREFSGWQKGIKQLQISNYNYDLVLFINEAFLVYNDNYLNKYLNTSINRSLKNNAVVGIYDKDQLKRTLSINGYKFKKWLRSNIFFVPKIIMDKMKILTIMENSEFDNIIPQDYPEKIINYKDCFTKKSIINDLYKQKIYEWLTLEWHSKISLNNDNWNIFRIKAKAILNEALLSVTIRSFGYKILWYAPIHIVFFNKIKKRINNFKINYLDKVSIK